MIMPHQMPAELKNALQQQDKRNWEFTKTQLANYEMLRVKKRSHLSTHPIGLFTEKR